MSYGWCPVCGAKIKSRTRGMPSIDTCENGHKNDARLTLKFDPAADNDLFKDLAFVPVKEKAHTYSPKTVVFLTKEMLDGLHKAAVDANEPEFKSVRVDSAPLCEGPMVSDEDQKAFAEQMKTALEKFVSPCPPPTPHENELLDILIEECAEVIQRATKMKRFGVEEAQPGHESNRIRLSAELGDLFAIVERVSLQGLVCDKTIEEYVARKHQKLETYLQTKPEAA